MSVLTAYVESMANSWKVVFGSYMKEFKEFLTKRLDEESDHRQKSSSSSSSSSSANGTMTVTSTVAPVSTEMGSRVAAGLLKSVGVITPPPPPPPTTTAAVNVKARQPPPPPTPAAAAAVVATAVTAAVLPPRAPLAPVPVKDVVVMSDADADADAGPRPSPTTNGVHAKSKDGGPTSGKQDKVSTPVPVTPRTKKTGYPAVRVTTNCALPTVEEEAVESERDLLADIDEPPKRAPTAATAAVAVAVDDTGFGEFS